MSEPADFIRARYAETREAAEACLNEVGATRAGDTYPDGSGVATSDDFPSYPWGMEPAELAYVQRQHPQDVIADLDAKLALIDEHPDVNDGSCGTCVDGQWGYPTHGASSPAAHPCRTLRILAQSFAGHPDHKGEEWAP